MSFFGREYDATDTDAQLASDPTTSGVELARIAATRMDLHPLLAANPATYPDLLTWLEDSPDPTVHAVLASRKPSSLPSEQGTSIPAITPSDIPLPTADPEPLRAPSTVIDPSGRARRGIGIHTLSRLSSSLPWASGATRGRIIARASRGQLAFLVTAIVAALLLVVGGITVFLTRPGTAVDSDIAWSEQWLNGYEQVWSVPGNQGTDHARITVSADSSLLLRTETLENAQVRLTLFSLGSSAPTELWSLTHAAHASSFTPVLWGSWVVTADALFSVEDGTKQDVPWERDALVSTDGQRLSVCTNEGTCALWTDLSAPVWTTEIRGFSPDYGAIPLARTLGSGSQEYTLVPGASVLLNLTDGTYIPLWEDESKPTLSLRLADGWVIGDLRTVRVFDAVGTSITSFPMPSHAGTRTVLPVKDGALTTKEFIRWVRDADSSWADTQWDVTQDETCGSITLEKTTVALPQAWYLEKTSGRCVLASVALPALVSQSPVLHRFGFEQSVLVDMHNGRHHAGPSEAATVGTLVSPSLWVHVKSDGTVSGYAPQ